MGGCSSTAAGQQGVAIKSKSKNEEHRDTENNIIVIRKKPSFAGSDLDRESTVDEADYVLKPGSSTCKVIILVDSFLMLEAQVEVHSNKGVEGHTKLHEGLKKLFACKSRSPSCLLINGEPVPFTSTAEELFEMVEHGKEYEVDFITV